MTRVLISRRQTYLLLGLGVIASLSLFSTIFGPSAPNSHQPTSTIISTGRHDVLDASVSAPEYHLKVSDVTIGNTDTTTQTRRVQVSVTLDNVSDTTLQISPGLQMSLLDSAGSLHPMTAEYISPDTVLGGPIEPGRAATYSVDFKLPARASPSAFIFQKDAGSTSTKVSL